MMPSTAFSKPKNKAKQLKAPEPRHLQVDFDLHDILELKSGHELTQLGWHI